MQILGSSLWLLTWVVSHFPEEDSMRFMIESRYSAPKGPLCVGRMEGGEITFWKSHRRGSKNHRRNLVSYINQPTYPQEIPHLNSSRQIRIFPISKDLLRSFHFLTLAFNRLPSQEHCSLAYGNSFIILPRLVFVLIISSAGKKESWVSWLQERFVYPSFSLGPLFTTLVISIPLRKWLQGPYRVKQIKLCNL